MEPSTTSPPRPPVAFGGRIALFLSLAAFAIANLIHNRFGFDPAIVPAALLAGLVAWRPRRPFLWGATLFIALPSFLFLNWNALSAQADRWTFANHVALLAAGLLAVASVVQSLSPTGAPRRQP